MTEELVSRLQAMCRTTNAEICGLVTSDLEIIPITNVATSPYFCFVFSKKDYARALSKIRSEGKSIAAIYHTHPLGSCDPSQADLDFIKASRIDALIVSHNDYRWIKCR